MKEEIIADNIIEELQELGLTSNEMLEVFQLGKDKNNIKSVILRYETTNKNIRMLPYF